jgi:hypothetical protein
MNRPRLTWRLAAVAVTTMLSATAAYAYSQEAVTDAQALLQKTTARSSYGEASAADVAVARYYLLEMEFQARQISRPDYCQSAKADLATIANSFEEQEGQVGQKKKWLDEIAIMDASPAGCDRAVATTNALLFGETEHPYTQAAVDDAQEQAKSAVESFNAGAITKADAAQAQYDLLEIKYGAKQIDRPTYCRLGLPLVQTVDDGIEQDVLVGQSTLEELIAAKRDLYKVKALCQNG